MNPLDLLDNEIKLALNQYYKYVDLNKINIAKKIDERIKTLKEIKQDLIILYVLSSLIKKK